MAKKAVKIILPIILILLSISGCWDSIDIEERDICTCVIVDKVDDEFVFYVEISGISSKIQNPRSEQDSGQQTSASVIKGSGKSYAEARAQLDKELNKPLYLGAVQTLILTERLADSDIEEYTLRLRQLTEYRKTMDVIVTPDDPEEFLKVQPENASAVGFAIEDTLETLIKLGDAHLSLADVLQKLESKNACFLMNTLSVKEGHISLIGTAVFDKGKRIGFIPENESHGLVYIAASMRNKPKFDYVITIEDKTVTLETTLKRRSIKANYDGDKPTFNLDLSYDAVVLYPSERIKITDDMRREFAGLLKEQIEGDIRKAIDTSQKEFACDYLSFSEPFRIAYPQAFDAINWHEEFKKAEFNINTSVKIIPNKTVDYNPEPIIK